MRETLRGHGQPLLFGDRDGAVLAVRTGEMHGCHDGLDLPALRGGQPMRLQFSVPGLPRPQGSKRAYVVRGKDGRLHAPMVESSKDVKPWRAVIALAARQALQERGWGGWFNREPLAVFLTFSLPRPKSLPKRIKYPVSKPDGDKLQRAAFDAMTNVVYGSDSQVVSWTGCKRYGKPGLEVIVDEITPGDERPL